MNGILDGITVIDLSKVIAGPLCGQMLGDMGAEVIKIERPGKGDENRNWAAYINGESCNYMSVNRNKKDITLDLQNEKGIEILYELVKKADVLIESFRPGVTEKLKIDYETLHSINPDLIYCTISGYGTKGDLSSRPGYDLMVQAYSGMMSMTGEEGQDPIRVGSSYIDIGTGLLAYNGVLTALLGLNRRKSTGQHINVSLLETAITFLGYHAVNHLNAGINPPRFGSGLWHLVPYQAFHTQNGFIITGATNDKAWKNFCLAIDQPYLYEDERFKTNKLRIENRDVLIPLLQKVFETNTREHWTGKLDQFKLPVSPVHELEEVMKDPQVLANEMVIEVDHKKIGNLKLLGFPVNFSETPYSVRMAPPLLSEHTEEILINKLGYTDDIIENLQNEGVI
ncbi:CaiB/BaiF CoA transferase family protein [Halalkalibacter flavus]|uniref:CaiB/BaiF CoA transferase family protein n=1 Tax=Halalkalibacter flavus TaxID=3090668 RepID=UPI002FC5BBC3